MAIESGKLIELGADALSIDPQDLIESLVTFVRAKGRDAVYLSAATVSSYGQPPGSTRRANWRFAGLLLDYFASDARSLRGFDPDAAQQVLESCYALVSDAAHRRARYNLLGTAEQAVDRFPAYAGLYLVIRHDTGDDDGVLRAEVLALDTIKVAGRIATYVTREVVYRGNWGGAKQTLSVTQHGYRGDYQPDVLTFNFSLAQENRKHIGGLATGTSTLEGWPMVTPVIAVQLVDAGMMARYQALWDHPDLILRRLAANIHLSDADRALVLPILQQMHSELLGERYLSPRVVAQASVVLDSLSLTRDSALVVLDDAVNA